MRNLYLWNSLMLRIDNPQTWNDTDDFHLNVSAALSASSSGLQLDRAPPGMKQAAFVEYVHLRAHSVAVRVGQVSEVNLLVSSYRSVFGLVK